MQRKILIVDKSLDELHQCRLSFERAGYQVMTRTNVLSLLQDIRIFHPHVMLLDIDLPQEQKEILFALLQTVSEIYTIPVILSSTAVFKAKEEKWQAGTFVTKPYNQRSLLISVAKVLNMGNG